MPGSLSQVGLNLLRQLWGQDTPSDLLGEFFRRDIWLLVKDRTPHDSDAVFEHVGRDVYPLLAAHASVGFDTQLLYIRIADGHVTLRPKNTPQLALRPRTSSQVSDHSAYPLEHRQFYHAPLARPRADFAQILQ